MDVSIRLCGALLLTLSLAGLTGCDRTPRHAADPVNPSVTPATTGLAAPINEDYWEAHFIGDQRVGYSHNVVTVEGAGKDQRVETKNLTVLEMKRFGQTVSQTIEVVGVETADGTPVSFNSSMKNGSQVMTASTGTWSGDALRIEATTQGKTITQNVAWQPTYGGPFASTQSLKRQPMKAGETRSVHEFMPTLNVIGKVNLTAKEWETTKLLEGEASLLRVEVVSSLLLPGGEQEIASTQWVNEQGEVLKSFLPQLNQTTYRTTKEKATAASTGSYDLAEATIVKLAHPLLKPHATKSITYKATLPKGKIDDVFVAGPTQSIKKLDEHTCELTVTAIRPTDPTELDAPDTQPTAEDTAPNSLIQSDDKLIVSMASSVAIGEDDAWKIARTLESFVHQTVDKKNFSRTFSTAAEVAQDREGDCTEHAVLLAALCRARGIPARTAIGLVYYPEAQGFAYHMWTEAWITDRWVPLDATLGRGGIGAGHIKVAHSNLKGADAYGAFLPVFKVLGQLKLEVIR